MQARKYTRTNAGTKQSFAEVFGAVLIVCRPATGIRLTEIDLDMDSDALVNVRNKYFDTFPHSQPRRGLYEEYDGTVFKWVKKIVIDALIIVWKVGFKKLGSRGKTTLTFKLRDVQAES